MAQALSKDLKEGMDWLLRFESSTRSVAVMRIFIVANVWARWGNDHVLYRDLNPEALLSGMLFFVASTCAFFGIFTRVAMAFLAATTMYFVYVVGHVYGHEPYTHHHTTLLANACLLLSFAPCGRSLSVDRWFALRKAEKENTQALEERANLWALRLMALQVAAIYFWGAVDKTNVAFLSGARMSHYLMYYYTGPIELDHFIFGSGFLMQALAVLTVGLEYALAFGLLVPEYRRWLLIPGLLLHGVFYFSLSVFTYSTTMWALYLAVVDPDAFDRVLYRLLGVVPAKSEHSASSPSDAVAEPGPA